MGYFRILKHHKAPALLCLICTLLICQSGVLWALDTSSHDGEEESPPFQGNFSSQPTVPQYQRRKVSFQVVDKAGAAVTAGELDAQMDAGADPNYDGDASGMLHPSGGCTLELTAGFGYAVTVSVRDIAGETVYQETIPMTAPELDTEKNVILRLSEEIAEKDVSQYPQRKELTFLDAGGSPVEGVLIGVRGEDWPDDYAWLGYTDGSGRVINANKVWWKGTSFRIYCPQYSMTWNITIPQEQSGQVYRETFSLPVQAADASGGEINPNTGAASSFTIG